MKASDENTTPKQGNKNDIDISDHAKNRQKERGVSDNEIADTVNKPSKVGDVKYDDKGRASQRVENENIVVIINPDTGKVITTWRKHSK